MINETLVRLKIISNRRSPEAINEMLGLESDKSWGVGEKRAHTIIKEKSNGWLLSSRLNKSASLDEHIRNLLERLRSHADKIRFLSREDTVEFSCVVYASSPPALYFDKEIIRELSEMGASLDIDLYVLAEERQDVD